MPEPVHNQTKAVFFMYARPLFSALQVLNLQMADGAQGDGHADDTKLHGKPDKTLRFSLCSDNLEGISEGQSAVWWHRKAKNKQKQIPAVFFSRILRIMSEKQEK